MSDVSRTVSARARKIFKITPNQKPPIVAIYTDGKPSSKSKPSRLLFATIDVNGRFIRSHKIYGVGNVITCNEAKFLAVKWALEWFSNLKQKKPEIIIYTNLEMLVQALKGEKKIHNKGLKSIYKTISQKLSLTNAKIEWSSQTENKVFLH